MKLQFEYTPDKDFLGDDKVVFEVTANGQKFRVSVVVKVVTSGAFNDACLPPDANSSVSGTDVQIAIGPSNRGQTTVFSTTKINMLITKYIYIFYEKPWSVPDIPQGNQPSVNTMPSLQNMFPHQNHFHIYLQPPKLENIHTANALMVADAGNTSLLATTSDALLLADAASKTITPEIVRKVNKALSKWGIHIITVTIQLCNGFITRLQTEDLAQSWG